MGSEKKEKVEKINSFKIGCWVLFTELNLFTKETLLMQTLKLEF